MKRILIIVGKSLAALLLFSAAVLCLSGVSPIYDFGEAAAFSGPDIFDPYASFDPELSWKKANFHTHTRVKGPLNECPYWPDEVVEDYSALGYDIVALSNHNALTEPVGQKACVPVYEHGYGLCKYHKNVFGPSRVRYFDHLLPVLASQKQWQLDYLHADADLLQMNHPFRTWFTNERDMARLTGYEIMELDSGVSTEQEYWDWALSAGQYSFGLANDDNHDSKDPRKIALRANFLNLDSTDYASVLDCLRGGCWYAMRLPEAWNIEAKLAADSTMAKIEDIGVRDGHIYMRLTRQADSVKLFGQGHKLLDRYTDCCVLWYLLPQDEPYVRITAYFPDASVIYTNPFARYDKNKAPSPFRVKEHKVNIWLTVLWNALLLCITALLLYVLRFLAVKGRR